MLETRGVARAGPRSHPVNGARHRAAVLWIAAVALWWHQWVPALIVVGFLAWVGLHKRLEGHLGDVLAPVWWRAWPPTTLVLLPLLAGSPVVYWLSDHPITPKLLPIALNVLALAMVACGAWRGEDPHRT